MINTYLNPEGPEVRVGVLQHQKSIKFEFIGDYSIIDKNGNHILDVSKQSGEIKTYIKDSQPAFVIYKLILFKERDSTVAHRKAVELDLQPRFQGNIEITKVGFDYYCINDYLASNSGYWICFGNFKTIEEANKCKSQFDNPERIDIVEKLEYTPSGQITLILGDNREFLFKDYFTIQPKNIFGSRIIIKDVIVGIGFHWEHKENQRFRGAFEIRIDNKGLLTAINIVPIELYLCSVNSSEMRSVNPDELLKAQTIAARNTVFATITKHHHSDPFDVCADDHCQCYRGSSRETEQSRRVVIDTLSEILVYDKEVCDTRYSKICGGIMESFDSVWWGNEVPYMINGYDCPDNKKSGIEFVENEEQARKFIMSSPDVFCNTVQEDVPDYLLYAREYFRWKIKYTRKYLEELLRTKSKIDVGEIKDIVVIKRGKSGRIEFLKIIGSESEKIIGKELAIRYAFSEKCLYSSCFVIDFERDNSGKIRNVILTGAGWGHGAGMCQIGATMMALKGYKYSEILTHYYKDSKLIKLYSGEINPEELERKWNDGEFRYGDRCWEFFNCYEVNNCPYYQAYLRGKNCWDVPNTTFFGEIQDTPDKKQATCCKCEYYKFVMMKKI